MPGIASCSQRKANAKQIRNKNTNRAEGSSSDGAVHPFLLGEQFTVHP